MSKKNCKGILMLIGVVLVLCIAVALSTCNVYADEGYPASVTVNGGVILNSDTPCWSNGAASATSVLYGGEGARYDPSTGTLELIDYQGKGIRFDSSGKLIKVIVEGDCVISTTGQFGIYASKNSMEITGDGSLNIIMGDYNATSLGGIVTFWSGGDGLDMALTISGSVDINVKIDSTNQVFGIKTYGDFTIKDNACVDVDVTYGPKAKSTTVAAVVQGGNMIINTSGNINLSASPRDGWVNSSYSSALHISSGTLKINKAEFVSLSAVGKSVNATFPYALADKTFSGFSTTHTNRMDADTVFIKSNYNYGGAFPVVGAFFPDPAFRSYVSDNFDTNNDGWLSNSEVGDATEIAVYGNNTSDAKYFEAYSIRGIEWLPNLECIYWNGSINYKTGEIINKGNIRSLDLTGCIGLSEIQLEANMISDVTFNTEDNENLFILDLMANELKTVELNGLQNLEDVMLQKNSLTTISIEDCPNLNALDVSSNMLTDLDFMRSTLANLENLNANNNLLTDIELSVNTDLTELYVDSNQLESLDLSNLDSLQYLGCSWNSLTALDVSHTNTLLEIECSHNQLSSLTLGTQPALRQLFCFDNEIGTIDLRGCALLKYVYSNVTPAIPEMAQYEYEEYAHPTTALKGWLKVDKDQVVLAMEPVILTGASLTFQDKIFINYKMLDPYYSGCYAELYYEQKDGSLKLVRTVTIGDDTWRENEGKHAITYSEVPAKEMTRILKIKVFDSNGKQLPLKIGVNGKNYQWDCDYTVATWAKNKQSSTVDYEAIFARSLLAYGKVAQDYFQYNLANPADGEVDVSDVWDDMASVTVNPAYTHDVSQAAVTAGLKSASPVFESALNINVKFSKIANVKIDNEPRTLDVYSDGVWYTVITRIPAKEMHKLHTITVDGIEAHYGALSWANSMLKKTDAEAKDKQMARAMYIYNKYARLYLKYDMGGLQ